jgi:hypothetical protein
MNKWKIAFFLSLVLLFLVTVISAYIITDQAVSAAYMRDELTDTENDLKAVLKIASGRSLTRKEVEKVLSSDPAFAQINLDKDTISLNRVILIFENSRLVRLTETP